MGHREDLLAAARRCLEERGYAHTTARDLVAASGTNLASIGYHFGSKDALLTAAMSESFREWAERVRALALAAEPDADPVRMLVASWGAMLTSFTEYRGLAVAFIEAMAQAERSPQLRAELADLYATSRAQVAHMITELSDLTEPQASTLAAFQIALCDGLLVQWLVNPDATPSPGDLVSALHAALTPRESGHLSG
ncbi:TetR/AcrR family transcriptional regulator [Pseudonocardia acaciae]|uniref:TetR/AcrR family transcriptional regulator n=1 Tax=Pseudonocardia acaciae TaxID=551276 RepID=UPI00048C702B|nr:TetR/AcrR family transcriptional regulator [Pseudonocardia acaciae]